MPSEWAAFLFPFLFWLDLLCGQPVSVVVETTADCLEVFGASGLHCIHRDRFEERLRFRVASHGFERVDCLELDGVVFGELGIDIVG